MTKLNQLLAIEKSAKTAAAEVINDLYHRFQRTELFTGHSKTYLHLDQEEAERGIGHPDDVKNVQIDARDALGTVVESWARMINVAEEKDQTNREAIANVEVDGSILMFDVPATHLLFLEKQLDKLHTLISKVPKLDPKHRWEWDPNVEAYVTQPTETNSTRKVKRRLVLFEPTDRQPGQAQVYDEDEIIGKWTTVHWSGSLPAHELTAILDRVKKLRDAVRQAREEANLVEVAESGTVGDAIFEYVFAELNRY